MFKFSKKAKLATLAAMSMVASGAAMADVPAAVTTAITQGGTDSATVAGAVLVVIVGIAVFKYMRRAV
ncbi:Bacteriophage coat protein B [Ralstonia sp. 25mfcol4.1]|uniref:major capsid protein n=1 Tax=Ralstonia sp. 25mfcol4.1 TaxID=1761899 RepID=UPI0008876E4B|nr:major capsid protein [Ralstonia sp. 25mfcol4.1]SDP38529.1 Bacteriophage coat protein B [Ralstonia sp. 25mfcol4.1]